MLFRKQRERASEQRGVSRFCQCVESEANLPVSVEAGSADVLPLLGRVLMPKSGQIDQGMQSGRRSDIGKVLTLNRNLLSIC
jgi:hypothetical protein